MTCLGKSGKVAEGQTGVNKAKTVGNYVPGGGTASCKCHVAGRTVFMGGIERRPVVYKVGVGEQTCPRRFCSILRSMESQ